MVILKTNLYKQAQSEPVDPGLGNDTLKPGIAGMFLDYGGIPFKKPDITKMKRKKWKKDPKTIVLER